MNAIWRSALALPNWFSVCRSVRLKESYLAFLHDEPTTARRDHRRRRIIHQHNEGAAVVRVLRDHLQILRRKRARKRLAGRQLRIFGVVLLVTFKRDRYGSGVSYRSFDRAGLVSVEHRLHRLRKHKADNTSDEEHDSGLPAHCHIALSVRTDRPDGCAGSAGLSEAAVMSTART